MSEPREPRSGDVYVRASGKLDDGVMETAPNVEWSESCAANPNYRFVCNRGEVLLLLRDNPAVVEMLDAIREGRTFLLEVGEGEDAREVMGFPRGTFPKHVVLVQDGEDRPSLLLSRKAFDVWGWSDEIDGTLRRAYRNEQGDFATAVNAALESEG